MTVRKRGKKFQLISKRGKVLGTHSSKGSALRQERAIQASKHQQGRKGR